MQKADIQPADGADPNRVALDDTVIQLDDERFWPYAAVNPTTTHALHVLLNPWKTTTLIGWFLGEHREKHAVDDA